eukprot:scaffold29138_cov51-Phaeocystis_antarctica.AAC.1
MLAAPVGRRRLDILHCSQEVGYQRALRAAIWKEAHGLCKTGGHDRLLDLSAAVETELARLRHLRRCGSER